MFATATSIFCQRVPPSHHVRKKTFFSPLCRIKSPIDLPTLLDRTRKKKPSIFSTAGYRLRLILHRGTLKPDGADLTQSIVKRTERGGWHEGDLGQSLINLAIFHSEIYWEGLSTWCGTLPCSHRLYSRSDRAALWSSKSFLDWVR